MSFCSWPIASRMRRERRAGAGFTQFGQFAGAGVSLVRGILAVLPDHQVRSAPDVDLGDHADQAGTIFSVVTISIQRRPRLVERFPASQEKARLVRQIRDGEQPVGVTVTTLPRELDLPKSGKPSSHLSNSELSRKSPPETLGKFGPGCSD